MEAGNSVAMDEQTCCCADACARTVETTLVFGVRVDLDVDAGTALNEQKNSLFRVSREDRSKNAPSAGRNEGSGET